MLEDKRVLTVDDSPTIRSFLHTLLSLQGAHVTEANSGYHALEILATNRYDLVLLDLLLPDLDGIQVLRALREHDVETAVVMLTGMGGIKSATTAVRQGADGYIEKQDLSFGGDYTEFFYALEQALEHRAGLVAQKQLQEIKTDFYSMVTHDLRNPAGAILLSLQLLSDVSSGPLNDNQHELLEVAQSATQKLLGLINDYLDFAKLDAGFLRLDRSETNLNVLVEECARLALLQAHARRQTLSFDMPARPLIAYVDGERLKQVLDNLLSNAIKYTPEGGTIRLQLRLEDEMAVFCVCDNGGGIPPAQLSSLFTKYHRVPGAAVRGIRGTGLGLLIVKKIIEAHDGVVTAESDGIPGHGTTFTVRLPLSREDSAAAERPDSPQPGFEHRGATLAQEPAA